SDESDAQVSDRPLDMAVSSFAPGAEIAKDKQIHVCVGFAAWEFRGQTPQAVDPLGTAIRIKKCDSCGAVEATSDDEGAPCAFCLPTTRSFDLYQPLGFRTDYSPRDYDDQTEWGSGSGSPELGWTADEPDPFTHERMAVTVRSRANVYTINDN